MDFDRRAQEIIEGAEKALAALAAEAASDRDYPSAGMLLALAQRIATTVVVADVRPEEAAALAGKTAQPNTTGGPSMRADRKKTASQYPRFKRDDDMLVKVGWSKSDRTTYEHRGSRSVLDNLVRRIQEVGAKGLRFTTEQVLPMINERGAEVPSYQCYLCIVWLTAEGLIDRHGRQGYTLHDEVDLPQRVEAAWQALPKR